MPATNTERQPTDEAVAVLPAGEDYPQVQTHRLQGVAKIAGAEVRYTYEKPFEEHDVTDPIPVLIAHGYGGVERSYRRLRTSLAEMGKPAITYRPARSKGVVADLNPLHLLHPNTLSSQAVWGVMRDVKDRFGHDTFDVSGHSMGGQTIANLASRKPDHIRSAIFVGSVGLDEHSVPQMLCRALRFLPKELAPLAWQTVKDADARIALESIHYIMRNPSRTILEGLATAACNLHESIGELHEAGIEKAAIQFQNDVFFPLDAVIRDSRHLFDPHHHVYERPGSDHLTPQKEPREMAALHLRVWEKMHLEPTLPLAN